MNKSIAIAGAISLALGTLEILPASAGTITFDYRDGYADSTLNFNPLVTGLLGSELGVQLPSSFTTTASDLTGSFTFLDDPAQFTDGDITLDYDFLQNILGTSPSDYTASLVGSFGLTPDMAVAAADSLFDLSFSGTGTIDTGAATTDFAFNYFSDTNSIVFDGFDTGIVAQCLSLTCTTTAQGNLGLNVVLSSILDLNTQFNLGFSDNTINLISGLEAFGISTIPVASGVSNFGFTADPVATDPNGEELSATVTDGTLSIAATFPDGEVVTLAETTLATSSQRQPVPEPVSVPGMLLGLLGAGAWVRKQVSEQ